MSKYIDAEKLKKLIDEKWKELADKNVKVGGGKWDAEISTYLSVLRLIDSLQQEQPSLSSNLTAAAEEYAPDFSNDFVSKAAVDAMRDAFKAGAEWMAEQGHTFETIMQNDDVDELVPTCPDMYNHGYSSGDKVVVQIRKKEE